jgi:drug/metabolite transporter (DMT)-like permease
VQTIAFACLLAGGCAIGFAPVLVRWSETGPVASAFWRAALAAPLLWTWAAHADPHPRPVSGRLLLSAGLFFAADLGVWHWSITWTSVANATLLANLAPIFVTLGARVLFGHAVTPMFLAGMTLAIAGMLILVGPNFALGGTRLAGDALGALTAVFYAGYMLSVKASRDAGASTSRLMAWSTTWTAVALGPVAWLSPQAFVPQGAAGWTVLLALALVSQIAGQGLIAYALAHLPASLSSVSLLIQPVMAAYLGWGLLGERVGVLQFAGGAVVLSGIALAKRGS